MALNYCPNCGAKIAPDTKFCPNCGCPLQEATEIEETREQQERTIIATPKDPSWVEKWRSRANVSKILELLLFSLFLIPMCIATIRLLFDAYDLGSIIFMVIFLLLFIIAITVLMIYTVVSRKFIVREIDGYTVVLFMKRTQNALIIEDEVVSAQALHHSRYQHTIPENLYGILPNRTRIHANFEDHSRPVDIYIDGRD